MKYLVAWVTLTFVGLLFVWVLFARGTFTGTVHGRVRTPQGESSANVSVTLRSRKGVNVLLTRTDLRGRYRFDGISPGEYLIEAVDVSSTFGALELVTLGAGDEITQDIRLKVRGMLTEIQVTAAGMPQTLREVAKAVDVLDNSEIRQRAEYAIFEAMRNIPGVRVKQSGGPGALTSIQARGMRQYDTALLIDGLRLRDAAGTQGSATSFYENLVVIWIFNLRFTRDGRSDQPFVTYRGWPDVW